MQLNEYQKEALSMRDKRDPLYLAMSLSVSSSDILDKLIKILRDNEAEFTEGIKLELIKQLGVVFWYVAALADELDYDLEAVAKINLSSN